MTNQIKNLRKLKKSKGQTALEYALVVAAISLVLLAAWNIIGGSVQEAMLGGMQDTIMNQLNQGNDTVPAR